MREFGIGGKQAAQAKMIRSADARKVVVKQHPRYTKLDTYEKDAYLRSGGVDGTIITIDERLKRLDNQRDFRRTLSHVHHPGVNGRRFQDANIQRGITNVKESRKRGVPKKYIVDKYGKENLKRFYRVVGRMDAKRKDKLNPRIYQFPEGRKHEVPKIWNPRGKPVYETMGKYLDPQNKMLERMAEAHWFRKEYGVKEGHQKLIAKKQAEAKMKSILGLIKAEKKYGNAPGLTPENRERLQLLDKQRSREAVHRYLQAHGLPGGLREAKAVQEYLKATKAGHKPLLEEVDFLQSRFHGMLVSHRWEKSEQQRKSHRARRGLPHESFFPNPDKSVTWQSLPADVRLKLTFTQPLTERVKTFVPSHKRGKLMDLYDKNPGSFKTKINRRTKKAAKAGVEGLQKSFNAYKAIKKNWIKGYVSKLNFSDIDNYIYGNRWVK